MGRRHGPQPRTSRSRHRARAAPEGAFACSLFARTRGAVRRDPSMRRHGGGPNGDAALRGRSALARRRVRRAMEDGSNAFGSPGRGRVCGAGHLRADSDFGAVALRRGGCASRGARLMPRADDGSPFQRRPRTALRSHGPVPPNEDRVSEDGSGFLHPTARSERTSATSSSPSLRIERTHDAARRTAPMRGTSMRAARPP